MTKRHKIVIASILAATLSFIALLTDFGPGVVEVTVVLGLVYLLSAWALQPDLEGIEYGTLLALPMILTAAVILTGEVENLPIPWKYFLPPAYGAGMYVTLLSENIFSVSAQRLVPLLRAAQTIGYLLTLGATFLFSGLLYSRHLPSYFNFLAMFAVGGAAVGQALWQVQLHKTDTRRILLAMLVSATSIGELALVISFWPIHPLEAGIVLTTAVYFLVGLIQHSWQDNLTKRALGEYLFVTAAVLLLLLFTTSWSG